MLAHGVPLAQPSPAANGGASAPRPPVRAARRHPNSPARTPALPRSRPARPPRPTTVRWPPAAPLRRSGSPPVGGYGGGEISRQTGWSLKCSPHEFP